MTTWLLFEERIGKDGGERRYDRYSLLVYFMFNEVRITTEAFRGTGYGYGYRRYRLMPVCLLGFSRKGAVFTVRLSVTILI